jgi:hypothetical protein
LRRASDKFYTDSREVFLRAETSVNGNEVPFNGNFGPVNWLEPENERPATREPTEPNESRIPNPESR